MRQLIRILALVLCVWALLAVILWGTQLQKEADVDRYQDDPLEPLTVQVLDVGKGDAILLTCQDSCMVIDTGYDDTFPVLQQALEDAGVDQIDTLILTHFDKDHVGGADKLIESWPIDQLLIPPYSSDSKQYRQFVEAAGEAGLTAQVVCEPLEITFGDASGTLYPPLLEEYEDENNYSLAFSLSHGADSFLFPGDAENDRLQELIGLMPLEHTFLKVPHHGRPEENTASFIRAVSPQYAVITCEKDDPDPKEVRETLDLLQSQEVETFLTYNGSVTLVSIGTGELTVTQG